MAQKKKPPKRRKDSAVSLSGVAEAIMLANQATQAAFNLSAWDWVSDGWTSSTAGRATGSGEISLHELIYGNFSKSGSLGYTPVGGSYVGANTNYTVTQTPGAIAMANLQNNWAPALVKMTLIPVGFKIGRKTLKAPIRMGNKLLKQMGLRGSVKI